MAKILTPNFDKPILGAWYFESETKAAGPVAVAAGVTASPGTTIVTAPAFTAQWPTSLKLTAKAVVYDTGAGNSSIVVEIYDVTNAATLDATQSYRVAINQGQGLALQAIATPAVGVATTYRITCWHSAASAAAVMDVSLIIDKRRI